jgi:hypothetical protein
MFTRADDDADRRYMPLVVEPTSVASDRFDRIEAKLDLLLSALDVPKAMPDDGMADRPDWTVEWSAFACRSGLYALALYAAVRLFFGPA